MRKWIGCLLAVLFLSVQTAAMEHGYDCELADSPGHDCALCHFAQDSKGSVPSCPAVFVPPVEYRAAPPYFPEPWRFSAKPAFRYFSTAPPLSA
ncbi:MAG: hypothetical protein LBH41_00330 [Rickettsiales bacterium]|nr:hypothetical protein [Rickettsiales bacterium]